MEPKGGETLVLWSGEDTIARHSSTPSAFAGPWHETNCSAQDTSFSDISVPSHTIP